MEYSGNEFEQEADLCNLPNTGNFFSQRFNQAEQQPDKSAEIRQALELAKANTFRIKKKMSTVTKIELMPQPPRKRQIETIAIDKSGK